MRQDAYKDLFTKAYAPITAVEKVNVGTGETYYKLSIDSGYSRDIGVDGALYGQFFAHPKTKVIGQVAAGSTIIDVCLLYTSPSPRDKRQSRMPSSA